MDFYFEQTIDKVETTFTVLKLTDNCLLMTDN